MKTINMTLLSSAYGGVQNGSPGAYTAAELATLKNEWQTLQNAPRNSAAYAIAYNAYHHDLMEFYVH